MQNPHFCLATCKETWSPVQHRHFFLATCKDTWPPVQHRHFFLATCKHTWPPVQHRHFCVATCKDMWPPVQRRHFFLATCGPVQHRQFLLATCKEHVATNATTSPNRIVLLLLPPISLSPEKKPSCCAALHSNCSLTTPTHFFLQILTSRFLCPLQIKFLSSNRFSIL